MYGKSINMVRCVTEQNGKLCGALISIPQGEKGTCPKCGCVRALGEYYAEHGKIKTKSAVQPLGMKTGLS